jgi:GAF domain-containing protein
VPAVRNGDARGNGAGGVGRSERRLDALMRLTRELLDTDIAILTEIKSGRETARWIAGEWAGIGEGESIPLGDTYCQRMLDGRIENYIRDAQADARVNELPMTRELAIGAYLGVPIRLEDMRLYVLCCLHHERRPSLGDKEVRLLSGLAESVRVELQGLN